MLSRRGSLLLPFLLAACGGREPRTSFPPLAYDYLTPLQLNVASIQVEQRFVPGGGDVGQSAPIPPAQALRTMAQDRLQALGAAGVGVFVIQNASLLRRRDTLSGNLAVELNIYTTDPPTTRAGFAQASVSTVYTGDIDDLRGQAYDLVKDMMDRMNVEFEYQVRRSLKAWLMQPGAAVAPVQQQSLDSGGGPARASSPAIPVPQSLEAPSLLPPLDPGATGTSAPSLSP